MNVPVELPELLPSSPCLSLRISMHFCTGSLALCVCVRLWPSVSVVLDRVVLTVIRAELLHSSKDDSDLRKSTLHCLEIKITDCVFTAYKWNDY